MQMLKLTIVMMFVALQLQAQRVTLKGRIAGSKSGKMYIRPASGPWPDVHDSIPLNTDGRFTYTTDKIKGPGVFSFSVDGRRYFALSLAPGYDLTLNAVADSLPRSMQLTGKGAMNNRYWASLRRLNTRTWPTWDEVSEEAFVSQFVTASWIDSAAKVMDKEVFGPDNTDSYKEYFRQGARAEWEMNRIYNLFMFAFNSNYSTGRTDSLLNKYFLHWLAKNMDDRNVASQLYIYFLSNAYLFHLQDMSGGKLARGAIADSLYTGKTHDVIMARVITNALETVAKPESLEKLQSYLPKIADADIKQFLIEAIADKRKEVTAYARYQPAPAFVLPDTLGKLHSLADFKDKVILLEFWASWCGPCKQAIPAMKRIREKYKERDDVVVISIAVNDVKGRALRYKIMEEQQMDWLQLEDLDGQVQTAYNARAIPRTVVLAPGMQIADFDAPYPGEPELETLIDSLLKK